MNTPERNHYTRWLKRKEQSVSLLVNLLLCASAMSVCSILKFSYRDTSRSPEPDSCSYVHQPPLKYIFGYHSQGNKIKFYPNKIILFSGSSHLHSPFTKIISCIRGLRHSILVFLWGLPAWKIWVQAHKRRTAGQQYKTAVLLIFGRWRDFCSFKTSWATKELLILISEWCCENFENKNFCWIIEPVWNSIRLICLGYINLLLKTTDLSFVCIPIWVCPHIHVFPNLRSNLTTTLWQEVTEIISRS